MASIANGADVTRALAVAAQTDLICVMACLVRPARTGWFSALCPDDVPEGIASGDLFSQPRKNPEEGQREMFLWVSSVFLKPTCIHQLPLSLFPPRSKTWNRGRTNGLDDSRVPDPFFPSPGKVLISHPRR
jgi:hypothetical protein